MNDDESRHIILGLRPDQRKVNGPALWPLRHAFWRTGEFTWRQWWQFAKERLRKS